MTTPAPPYKIRPMVSGDHDFLSQVHEESFREYIEKLWGWDADWQREHFKVQLEDPDREHYVIEVQGESAGYLRLREEIDTLFVDNIQIKAESQGLKIGTAIFQQLKQRAQAENIDLCLRVFTINSRAFAFYKKLGFVEEKRDETHTVMRWSHNSSKT